MSAGSSSRRRSSKQAGFNDNYNPTKITKASDNKRARHEFHEFASNGNSSGPAFTKYLDETTR
jgi:hypothetical protein